MGFMDGMDMNEFMKWQMIGQAAGAVGNSMQYIDAKQRGYDYRPGGPQSDPARMMQVALMMKEAQAKDDERKRKLAAAAQLFGPLSPAAGGVPWTNPDTGKVDYGRSLMDTMPGTDEQKQMIRAMGLMGENDKAASLMGALVNPAATKGTAPIQNFEYRSQLVKKHGESSPEVNRYDNYVRQNPWLNLGDQMVLPNPSQPSGPPVAAMPKGVPPQDQPALKGAQTKATETAKVDVDREAGLNKTQAAMADLEAKTGVVTQDIDRALANTGFWTSGFTGSLSSGVPGTSAHDMKNLINTIKSNVGFDQLAAMRAASPTGGALGSVTERENSLLQSVLGSLEQSQSPEQLKSNLERLKTILSARQARLMAAFEQDYGKAKQQKSPPSAGGWSIQRVD